MASDVVKQNRLSNRNDPLYILYAIITPKSIARDNIGFGILGLNYTRRL